MARFSQMSGPRPSPRPISLGQRLVVVGVGQPALPEPVGDAAGRDRPPGHGDHERDEPGDEADQAPDGVDPRLRVAQRREEAAHGARVVAGHDVLGCRRGAVLERPQPDPLEVGERAARDQGADQDRDSHPDHDEGDADREAGDHRGEGQDADRQGGQGVRRVEEQPVQQAAVPGGGYVDAGVADALVHVDNARDADAPGQWCQYHSSRWGRPPHGDVCVALRRTTRPSVLERPQGRLRDEPGRRVRHHLELEHHELVAPARVIGPGTKVRCGPRRQLARRGRSR